MQWMKINSENGLNNRLNTAKEVITKMKYI